ncbi:MAG TPA: hypothetical protein VFG52_06860 [Xanthomonadales bacterium]|nr:hypothetical protein [Xanthomonadales bacterium]
MKYSIIEISRSLLRLFRFVFWYSLAVALAFYVMPKAFVFLQAQYEVLNGATRIALLIGMLVIIVAGLIGAFRARGLVSQPPRLDRHS